MLLTLTAVGAGATIDSVSVTLQNARRTVTYKSSMLVDGKTVTLKGQTLTASEGNEIAALVVNGGKLVLDHCTIVKSGDGVRGNSGGGMGPGGPGGQRPEGMGGGERPQRPEGMSPGGEGGERPQMGDGQRPQRPEGDSIQGGQRRRPGGGQGGQRPGGGGAPGGGGDDGFNFYGTNSAVVAVGKGSTIEMIGCQVRTDAEYANAVFACDDAQVTITEGITINTTKGSSRGLFATTAGVIKAEGPVLIDTKGAHCAALATDRGGGTVTVGSEGTRDKSVLNTGGEGSPCIYSTGDIYAYNCTGNALVSQTMVIEGKNSITIGHCSLQGKSPRHGGVMLYQSTSGDASEGTSVLNMKDCTIRDNQGTAMFLITNTHSIVNMEGCTFLDKDGKAITQSYPLVTCRNCNGDGRSWGREGSNGGQVELNLTNQELTGTLLANETESAITITADKKSKTSFTEAKGNGIVNR